MKCGIRIEKYAGGERTDCQGRYRTLEVLFYIQDCQLVNWSLPVAEEV